MRILIDIYHTPQFNFFKQTILKLGPDIVDLCCVNRGPLAKIIQHECPGHALYIYGDYKYNKGIISMATKIIFPRLFNLWKLIHKNKYDFIITAHYQANFIARLLRIPNIAFCDDPRKGVFSIIKFSTDELFIPPFPDLKYGAKVFNALKEWAYLSPRYFTPDASVLDFYGIQKKKYIFVREVSTKTSNYRNQRENLVLSIAAKFPKGYDVLLSLENKHNSHLYPDNWTILNEPIYKIYSLIYYSRTVISSGDSMAREGAILGVPSIYCGFRNMPANQILIDKKMLFKIDPDTVSDFLQEILQNKIDVADQDDFRKKLHEEWDDVTEVISQKIKEYTSEKK